MNKKDGPPDTFQVLTRLALFALAAGGGIWWLMGRVDRQGKVEGEKTAGINRFLPEPVKKAAQQAVETVPKGTRRTIEKSVLGRVLGEQNRAVQDQAAKEIKNIIEKTTIQITGFPNRQKEEIKKQVIKQVCADLLKEDKGK